MSQYKQANDVSFRRITVGWQDITYNCPYCGKFVKFSHVIRPRWERSMIRVLLTRVYMVTQCNGCFRHVLYDIPIQIYKKTREENKQWYHTK